MGYAGVEKLIISAMTMEPAASVFETPRGLDANGSAMMSLVILINAMNITSYSVVQSEGNVIGTVYPNGSATGMCADLINERADIMLPLGHYSESGYQYLFSSHHVMEASFLIVGGSLREGDTDLNGYIKSFDKVTWLLMAISFAGISAVSVMLHKISFHLNIHQDNYRSLYKEAQRWTQQYFENLLLEASARLPSAMSLQIICAMWWLAVSIVSNSFAGNIKSCLMAKIPPPRINSVSELAKQQNMKPFFCKDSIIERTIFSSDSDDCRTLAERIRRCPDCRVPSDVMYADNFLRQVARGKAVLIGSDWMTVSALRTFCRRKRYGSFYIGKDAFTHVKLILYLRKTLPRKFLHKFNEKVRRFSEGNIVQRVLIKIFKESPILTECSNAVTEAPLRLEDVASLMSITMICLLVSTAVLSIEIATSGLNGAFKRLTEQVHKRRAR